MTTAVKALAAQMLGLAFTMVPAWLSPALFHGTTRLVILQGVAAASCAYLLRQPNWWIPIHLLFLPAAIALLMLQLPSWLYLVIALLLALIFWGTVKGDVPLFLSSPAVANTVAGLVEQDNAGSFADLGAGTGSLAVPLAQRQPTLRVDAVELAPLPWLISTWRCRKLANVRVQRTSLWAADLARYDAVFAFLSPAVMPKLAVKISREMRAGSLFISSSFPIPDWQPESVIRIEDRRKTILFCYRIKKNSGGQ